ncbi:hypothetical protein [Mycolicibacterium sp.]
MTKVARPVAVAVGERSGGSDPDPTARSLLTGLQAVTGAAETAAAASHHGQPKPRIGGRNQSAANHFHTFVGLATASEVRYKFGMPGPTMSRYASRARAKEAFELRGQRYSWREIAERLGFRSVGAAQSAVAAHVARERREPTATSIEAHKFGVETRTRALTQRFVAAFRSGDDDTLVSLNREIRSNEVELAKLGGFYAPDKLDVTVTQTSAAIIEDARRRLLEVVDAEVIEPKEIER